MKLLGSDNDFYSKLSPSASFAGDLGLDSLDAVEVVMAVEEVRYQALYSTIIF